MKLFAHLTFNGNCRQAMLFYQKCLGGELRFQTIGESPQSEKLSRRMRKCIVQASLSGNGFLLMGSDLTSDDGLIKGNAITLSLQCNTKAELKTIRAKLSTNGSVIVPLNKSFWNNWSILLKDKFGNHWMLHCKY